MKLYYYWNLETNRTAWAKTPDHYREITGEKGNMIIRSAHVGVTPPAGFKKTGRELACDPAVSYRKGIL